MAERRMLSKKIADDDNFTSLSASAQALYLHLNLGADDDGFNNQIALAMFKAHASEDDLKVLKAKKYILQFESGVIAIKHWRMNNLIRKDRYTETSFKDELDLLEVKPNGAYTINTSVAEWLSNGCQVVAKWLPQVRVVEERKEEVRQVEASALATDSESSENSSSKERKELQLMGGIGKDVVLLSLEQSDNLLDKLGFDGYNHYIEKLAYFIINNNAKVSNHYATILKWAREDAAI